jgi:predicted ATPase/DNA-binding CsgD family transcriptional regulator
MAETDADAPDRVGEPPVALTSLIGRQQETAAVRALLIRRSVRLVTLTGPGGVGKTRLAVQVASQLRSEFDAVAFVGLVAIREPDLVAPTIARSLGVDSPEDEIADGLRAYLRHRSMLLVLDNLEHLVAAGPHLAGMLRSCPGLTLLVTSRARLRISGEHVAGVSPLSLPDPGSVPAASDLARYDAVRLFVERSQAADPGFALTDANAADIVEVCRRLDGLPLAIELAAARSTVLPPAAMRARLDRRLPMLTEGPRDLPERLRTMRAGIEWSYDLLSPAERGLFRRLAVFAGGCTLAAAEFVGGQPHPMVIDLVGALVDSSLMQNSAVSHAGEPRFTMLETIREYALEQLAAAGEEDGTRRMHARHFCEMAEEAAPNIRGAEQQHWRDALEFDLDNFRAALDWSLRDTGSPGEVAVGLRMVGALWYFWFQRGLTGEGRRWLARALDRAPESRRGRAQALLGAGTLAWRQGDCAAARSYLDDSVRWWRANGDPSGLAEALHVLGHVRFDQREFAAARALFAESLDGYRRAQDTLGSLPLLGDLGLVAYHEGDYAEAETVLRDSVARYRQHGLKDRTAGALNGLGDLARLAGDHRQAERCYDESLTLWRELHGTPGIASALHKLAQVSRAQGDTTTARARVSESLALQRELGNRQGIGECLAVLAGIAADTGDVDRAARILGAQAALLASIGVPLAPADQTVLTRDIEMARTRLVGRDWEVAWATGSALSAEQAVALATRDDGVPGASLDGGGPLSRREVQVAGLVAEGLTNRQISTALSISEKTVGTHIEHIMAKLDLRSRTLIAVWAHERGLTGGRRPAWG